MMDAILKSHVQEKLQSAVKLRLFGKTPSELHWKHHILYGRECRYQVERLKHEA